MATRAITLSNDWQQITERGQSGFIQIISGIAYLCVSDTQPDESQVSHPRSLGDLNYSDTNIWGRSYNGTASIIVSGSAQQP